MEQLIFDCYGACDEEHTAHLTEALKLCADFGSVQARIILGWPESHLESVEVRPLRQQIRLVYDPQGISAIAGDCYGGLDPWRVVEFSGLLDVARDKMSSWIGYAATDRFLNVPTKTLSFMSNDHGSRTYWRRTLALYVVRGLMCPNYAPGRGDELAF